MPEISKEIKEFVEKIRDELKGEIDKIKKKITPEEKEEEKVVKKGIFERIKEFLKKLSTEVLIVIVVILLLLEKVKFPFPSWLRKIGGIVGIYWWIAGLIGAVVVFIYYANKWYYAEPRDKSIEEKERVARLKLIGILMMLFAGTLVFWFILYVFFVYFVGWTKSELISCWQLWLVGPVISWIVILTLPGTGKMIIKTIIIVCIIAVVSGIVGLYFDIRPVPPEIRVAKEVIFQSYKESVRPHIERIKGLKERLISARSLEEEKKVILEIKKEVEICREIRKRYSVFRNKEEKKIFLKPLYRMDFSYPWEPGLEKVKKAFKRHGAFPGISHPVRLVSQYKNRVIFESGKRVKVRFIGEFKDDSYRGKWIKYTERGVISTGGFELKFYGCCNEAGVGRWWFSTHPEEKYVLYFY
ncbi:hypothetical protein J7K44_00145 [bacterium]|nr:hypothetical protein [bacterium]